MNLFKILSKPDRQQTQLAYRVKYFPFSTLSSAAKELIVWGKTIYMRKADILDRLDENKITLTYNCKSYVIVWAYNNIPTQIEWEGKSDKFLIRVELRASPAIPEFAIAILNFELASSNSNQPLED